jgi:hypothetical protein
MSREFWDIKNTPGFQNPSRSGDTDSANLQAHATEEETWEVFTFPMNSSLEILTYRPDLHIYMIGVGVQQIFILLFFCFAIKFHRIVLRNGRESNPRNLQSPLTLLYILYVVLTLITVSITPALPLFCPVLLHLKTYVWCLQRPESSSGYANTRKASQAQFPTLGRNRVINSIR